MNRRRFLSVVLPALAAARCSRAEQAPSARSAVPATQGVTPTGSPASPVKLTAFKTSALCLVGWIVALERGFFAAEGLAVEFLAPSAADTPAHHPFGSFLNGPMGLVRGDLVVLEYQNLADLTLSTGEYYVVAGEHSGCRQLVVPMDSPVRSTADLAGKRIGLTSEFNDTIIWEYLARQAGASPGSIQWVSVASRPGTPEELEYVKGEFAAGRLDAYIGSDPTGEILKADGVARLVASNTWTAPLNGWYCCMIGVRRALIDANPDLAKAVTRAFRRSAEFIEKNPSETVALSIDAGFLPKDTRRDISARLLGEYVWTATGRIEEDLERYFSLLIEAGRLPKSSSPRELVARVYRGSDT